MKISLERVIWWVPLLRDVVGGFTHNLVESDFKIIFWVNGQWAMMYIPHPKENIAEAFLPFITRLIIGLQ